MSQWGSIDYGSGNTKPKHANTGNTYGVSATEKANTQGHGPKLAHAGWARVEIGRGPLANITITGAGTGINGSGYLTVTGGDATRQANVSYSGGTGSNNSTNTVVSITINDYGAGYNSAPTITYTGANTTRPTFSAVLGGRAGRVQSEVLVAIGSISGDDTRDNTFFPGT